MEYNIDYIFSTYENYTIANKYLLEKINNAVININVLSYNSIKNNNLCNCNICIKNGYSLELKLSLYLHFLIYNTKKISKNKKINCNKNTYIYLLFELVFNLSYKNINCIISVHNIFLLCHYIFENNYNYILVTRSELIKYVVLNILNINYITILEYITINYNSKFKDDLYNQVQFDLYTFLFISLIYLENNNIVENKYSLINSINSNNLNINILIDNIIYLNKELDNILKYIKSIKIYLNNYLIMNNILDTIEFNNNIHKEQLISIITYDKYEFLHNVIYKSVLIKNYIYN